MTKEEKIKEAYGEYFDKCKPDGNGWSLHSKFRETNFCYNSIEMSIDGLLWRIKSLQGIENNNGWIRIESESDLPKEDGVFWILDKKLGIKSGEWKQAPDEIQHKKACKFWIERATHYQPIIKPQPPKY